MVAGGKKRPAPARDDREATLGAIPGTGGGGAHSAAASSLRLRGSGAQGVRPGGVSRLPDQPLPGSLRARG